MELEGFPFGGLPTYQKRFWHRSVAADLEGAEVLVPVAFRHFRIRVNPESETIEKGDADRPVPHSVYQVLADGGRQVGPLLDPRHQLPKTIRPI